MNSFGDIQYLYTLDEYLETLTGARRELVRDVFNVSDLALNFAKQFGQDPDPIPEIRIRSNSTINAEAMPGRIYITEGLIAKCLDLSMPDGFHTTMEIPASVVVPLPHLALTFCLVHEYMHIARKHDECSQELGKSERFNLATEFDADLCSAAVIYRLAQFFYNRSLSDRDTRTIAFFTISWLILALPRSNVATSHSSTAERIFCVFTKICSLKKNPADTADPDCACPECREMVEHLTKAFLRISKLHPDLPLDTGEIFRQMITGFGDGPQKFEAAGAWEEISDKVVEILEGPKQR